MHLFWKVKTWRPLIDHGDRITSWASVTVHRGGGSYIYIPSSMCSFIPLSFFIHQWAQLQILPVLVNLQQLPIHGAPPVILSSINEANACGFYRWAPLMDWKGGWEINIKIRQYFSVDSIAGPTWEIQTVGLICLFCTFFPDACGSINGHHMWIHIKCGRVGPIAGWLIKTDGAPLLDD